MHNPLVSIIIPLYNSEKYIVESVTSALAQTWPNKEIIVVDDGSTDSSLSIAKNFESENVKVLSQENKGASAARNKGLSLAKGDYVQFLDADDLLSENKIEVQINQLKDHPNHLGLCGTVYFNDGDDPLQQPLNHYWVSQGSNDPVDFLIKLYGGALIGQEYGGMIQPNTWLTPRSLIAKSGLWNEMRNPDDDGEFFCRVILASSGIIYSKDAVNYYRKFIRSNNLSAQKSRESQLSILLSTDLKAGHLLSRTDSPQAKLALTRLYYDNAFAFYPKYPDLANEAETKAKALSPGFDFDPFEYKRGVPALLSKLIGWKGVRYLQHIKNNNFNA
jgi:glycosyltransferase involved in cell wall biosynthesis